MFIYNQTIDEYKLHIKFLGRIKSHHYLVNQYEISISQMTMDLPTVVNTNPFLCRLRLISNVTIHRICLLRETTGATSKKGSAFPSDFACVFIDLFNLSIRTCINDRTAFTHSERVSSSFSSRFAHCLA